MTKIWFKAKRYGYGWYPATWEGFGVLALYFLNIILLMVRVSRLHSENDVIWQITIPILIITIILIAICYLKGEEARWRWGGK